MAEFEKHEWSEEELSARRKRSVVIGLVLGGLAVLFFVTTVVKLTGNMAAGN